MGLGIVLASATSTTTKSSSSSGRGLSATGVGILLGVVALLLVSLAVGAWIASRDWRYQRRLRQEPPYGPAAVSLAARTAFARGDYMAVIRMVEGAEPVAARLLLAQSYARIGADGRAANTAHKAIEDILKASKDLNVDLTKGFSALELEALRIWLDRLASVEQEIEEKSLADLRSKVPAPKAETTEVPVQLGSALDEMRQRVAAERTAAQAATSRQLWLNLSAGTLASGLAAASGVAGVAKGPWAVIAVLAFSSAVIMAVLTTLKPAEREKESRVRADTLGQLAAAIDLFDVDRPDDHQALLSAVKRVHELLAIAEGHGKIVPLVASSQSTAATGV
jgi:uncharacterized protein YneF (UPF0154 family)